MQAIMETAFDVVYLVTVITLGIVMIRKGVGQYRLFGVMAVTLGCGDAFHLVPRAVALCTTGLASYTAALGAGKLVTSVTMTANRKANATRPCRRIDESGFSMNRLRQSNGTAASE